MCGGANKSSAEAKGSKFTCSSCFVRLDTPSHKMRWSSCKSQKFSTRKRALLEVPRHCGDCGSENAGLIGVLFKMANTWYRKYYATTPTSP